MDNKTAAQRLRKQYKYQNEWIKAHRDKYSLTMPLGTMDRIRSATDESVNSFINRAIRELLERLEASSQIDDKEEA